MTLYKEAWISGYEGRYTITTEGKVYSYLNGTRKALALQEDSAGYYRIRLLNSDGIYKTEKVHRLVANTFIKNPLKKPFVNHINGNPKDNSVTNLEWNTPKENTNHAWKTGLCVPNTKKVGQYDLKTGRLITVFNSIKEAGETLGISRTAISELCNKNKRRKSVGGFYWEFVQ